MKKLIILTILVLILGGGFAYFLLNNENQDQEINTIESQDIQDQEYSKLISGIEKGNDYILSNGISDSCFPYRYYHKGCYYEGKEKFKEGIIVDSFSSSNLSNEKRLELCYKFLFNGSVAYCLQQNNEIEKCLEFAKGDEYLERICSLEEEETIPTEGMWDPEYRDNPISTKYFNVDKIKTPFESSEEEGPNEDPEKSDYYNIINNIEDYEGEEIIFNNVSIISKDWSYTQPYWIQIIEEDGSEISLPLLPHKDTILLPHNSYSPNFWPTSNKWNFEGIIKKESRGYYLKVNKAEAIFTY